MSKCKRMTVKAIGIKGNQVYEATNYNETKCKNIPGQCGCVHAEIALFEKVIPEILIVSHSPCVRCAQAIINHGIKTVLYKEEYRIKDGLVLLEGNGVNMMKY
jgi:deoxycytidylate deaminase